MLCLPDHMRGLMRTSIGDLFDEEQLVQHLQQKKFVCIGDMVSYTVLKHGLLPVFCVVDFKTRRGSCRQKVVDLINGYGEEEMSVSNPKGCISKELWQAIEMGYRDMDSVDGLRIEVDGEEDLASLPAIYLAPVDVTIIYGLPDKGVLAVKPTGVNKQKVKQVLDRMVETE